jgi:hypothetical protein
VNLTLHLPPGLNERLNQEAHRLGVPTDVLAMQLLEKQLPPKDRRAEAIALLQSWIDADDGGEQQKTGDYLIRTLDEDRLSDRKLYPKELERETW